MLLHQHFKTPASGGAIRSYYLAEALTARQVEVEIITAHDEAYKVEIVGKLTVHYLKVPYNNRFGFAKRSIAFLSFVWKAIKEVRGIQNIDLCYAISVPLTVGLVAMWIKARHRIPFLFEVGDLWPDVPIQMGFVENYFFRKMLLALERRIYHSANAVVALSPSIQQAIERKVPGKKIYLIPNMADTSYYKMEAKDPDLEAKFGVCNQLVISYLGAIGVANGLDYLIASANACRKAALPVRFIIGGDGAHVERLKAHAGNLGLSNVTFLPFMDRQGVGAVMNVTDAVLVCYKQVPILETGSPHKFFDGLAAGKLVLINFGGWINKEITDNQCGVYLNPNQPEEIVGKIKYFLADPNRLKKYQQRARHLAESKYSREILGAAFYKIILAEGG